MTHENIFKEIEEDLERQRYEQLWKKYGPLIIGVAFAIVIGTAVMNMWQGHKQVAQQRATGNLVSIVDGKDDPQKKIMALEDFALKNMGQTQAALAALHAASLAAKNDKKADAIKLYDAVAGDTKADHAFRQLADLSSVELQLDSGDPAALQSRLEPLMGAEQPWHSSAMELSAHLALRSGDKEKAKKLLTDLSQEANAPASLKARADDMIRLLAE